jgi:hypothetical protein
VTVNYQGGQPESGINAVKNAKWRYVVGNLPTAQNNYTIFTRTTRRSPIRRP